MSETETVSMPKAKLQLILEKLMELRQVLRGEK